MGGDGSGRKTKLEVEREMLDLTSVGLSPEAVSIGEYAMEAVSGLMDLDTDVVTWLYRLWPIQADVPSKNPAYIEKYVGPIDIADIAARHGGGIYRVRYKDKKAGKYDSKTFSIGGPPKITMEDFAQPSKNAEAMNERLDKLEGMITALANKGNGNASMDRLKELQLMSEIIRGNNNGGGAGIEQMVAVFSKGIEIAQQVNKGDDNWASVLKDAIPQLLPLLQPKPIVLRPRPKPQPGQLETAQSPKAQSVLNFEPPAEEKVNIEFVQLLADTVNDALDAGDPPEKVAKYIARFLTDDDIESIKTTTPEQIDLFCKELLAGREKGKEFVIEILKFLTSEVA